MTPFFFGPVERRLYGVYHPPAAASRTALQVLLWAPFGQEAGRTHRLHRPLAHHLAGQGIPALLASQRSVPHPLRIVLWETILHGPTYLQELGDAHAMHTFDPFIHARRPSSELHREALGFGLGDHWLQEMRNISVQSMRPACLEGCYHIGTEHTPPAELLSGQLKARGLGWRHLPTKTQVAWHVEEAGSASLAPPELLRLMASAVKGEAE